MANDVTSGNSKFKYEWNPFQDLVDNRILKEPIHSDGPTKPIIVPRCGPFFADKFAITLKGSSTPLSFEAGDYSFVYPYMTFVKGYQKLCYGGVLLHKLTAPGDYTIDYDTIGGDYVLDDVNYAQFIVNILNNPRTVNLEQIINFPTEFPPDPHDHPAKDTVGYLDLVVFMKSYLDAIVGIDTSLTLAKQFGDHIMQDLSKAHGGGLTALGIMNLKDYPIANSNNYETESTEIYANLWAVRKIIRDWGNGVWK